jgi:hypothetical protein
MPMPTFSADLNDTYRLTRLRLAYQTFCFLMQLHCHIEPSEKGLAISSQHDGYAWFGNARCRRMGAYCIEMLSCFNISHFHRCGGGLFVPLYHVYHSNFKLGEDLMLQHQCNTSNPQKLNTAPVHLVQQNGGVMAL